MPKSIKNNNNSKIVCININAMGIICKIIIIINFTEITYVC
ncbi:MAG: hypothetical protein ACI4VC_01515 [Clostridia bacterium]